MAKLPERDSHSHPVLPLDYLPQLRVLAAALAAYGGEPIMAASIEPLAEVAAMAGPLASPDR